MRLVRGNNAEGAEVREFAEERLKKFRAQLESLTCTNDDARELRGRIAELKNLIECVNNNGDANV